MTTIGSSPLPAREGTGVGFGAPAPSATPVANSLRSSPTPSPSLAGRGATGIASGLNRANTATDLKKAGEQFEAVFTGMMLKSMRQAKLAEPLFDSKALDTFREMQDGNVAKAMATAKPMGIGKAMVDFLKKSQPDLNEPPPDSVP